MSTLRNIVCMIRMKNTSTACYFHKFEMASILYLVFYGSRQMYQRPVEFKIREKRHHLNYAHLTIALRHSPDLESSFLSSKIRCKSKR